MRRSLLVLLMGAIAWTPQVYLFGSGEQGAHYEAYNPQTLLERTNWIRYSEQADNAAWSKTDCTVAANADGVADKLIESTNNAQRFMTQTASAPLAVGATAIAVAVRAKADGRNFIWLQNGSNRAFFDVSTGAYSAGTATAAGISPAADAPGYYDCWAYFATSTNVNFTIGLTNALGYSGAYLGDGVSGVLVTRMQFNAYVSSVAPLPYQLVTDWNTEYLAAALNSIGMWQDNLGQTPVTSVEQSVGLWLDGRRASGGAWARSAQIIANTALNDATNWGVPPEGTISGNKLNFAATLASRVFGGTCTAYNAGDLVEVTYTISNYSAGTVRVIVGSSGVGTSRTANGTYTERIVAPAAGSQIQFQGFTGTTASVDAGMVAVVVAGNHASQGTSGQRPVLKALHNVVTNTELLTAAAWVKIGTATAPTANTLSLLANNDYVYHNVTPAATYNGEPMTVRAELSGVAGTSVRFGLYDNVNGFTNCQEVVLSATPTVVSLTITPGSATDIRVMCGRVSITGTPASTVTFSKIDVRPAYETTSNIPSYQRVNTATDYDTVGFPHYLKFDLFDDNLQAAGFDLSGTSKVISFAAITKLSDAAAQVVAEHTTNSDTLDGSFSFWAPSGAGLNTLYASSRGTIRSTATPGGLVAPLTTVMTSIASIAGDSVALRVDGAVAATGVVDQGTGNYANATHYIGRRGGSTAPFGGRLYAYTVRDNTNELSAAQIAQMNTYLGAKQGRTL